MSWHFWVIPLVLFWFFRFGRRWQRPSGQWKRHRHEEQIPSRDPEVVSELESQRDYIGTLETRVAELENRLDFTERLLAGRARSEQSAG